MSSKAGLVLYYNLIKLIATPRYGILVTLARYLSIKWDQSYFYSLLLLIFKCLTIPQNGVTRVSCWNIHLLNGTTLISCLWRHLAAMWTIAAIAIWRIAYLQYAMFSCVDWCCVTGAIKVRPQCHVLFSKAWVNCPQRHAADQLIK